MIDCIVKLINCWPLMAVLIMQQQVTQLYKQTHYNDATVDIITCYNGHITIDIIYSDFVHNLLKYDRSTMGDG